MTTTQPQPPLPLPDAHRIAELAHRRGLLWGPLHAVASTGSTNADLAALAAAGEPAGAVLVAGAQTAGRGRQGRTWESPAGESVSVSLLVRLTAAARPMAGWLPLIAGLGVRAGLAEVLDHPIGLKWPNDLLVEGGPRPGKVAGILAEAVPGAAAAADAACVVGFGINLAQGEDELPIPAATSLRLAGAEDIDPSLLVVQCLAGVERYLQPWLASGADAERAGTWQAYRSACLTIGRRVRVAMPGGHELIGTAKDVDIDGHLVVEDEDGRHVVSAGDVVHLRAH